MLYDFIYWKKNSFTADTVDEEPVPEDNFCFQSTETFTTNVEKKKKKFQIAEKERQMENFYWPFIVGT